MVDPPGSARLWLPPLGLSSCIRGLMLRDTMSLDLDHQALVNHFPVTFNCGLTWVLQGRAEELLPGEGGHGTGPSVPLASNFVFNGPFNRPLAGRYPQPSKLLVLAIMPDAFTLLTGLQPGDYLNRMVPVQEVLGAPWQQMGQAVFDAASDEERMAVIEARLGAWWQAVRPAAPAVSHLMDDWLQGLSARASTSSLGRSARQIERRIKQWTGQPLRELRGVSRSERAFFQAAMAHEEGDVNWAEVADEAGYTDQSHLCRQTRRLTGFSPEELRRRIATDEGFWMYRLWGFSEINRQK